MIGNKIGTTSIVPRYWALSPISMMGEIERLFSGMSPMKDLSWGTGPSEEGFRMPMVDMKEEKDRFLVQAEVPGMGKEDVSVEVEGNSLKISAFKEHSSEHEEEGYMTKERGCMRFHRRVMLPEDVDREGIKARMENGVLEISLPKVVAVEGKNKIQVE